MIIKSACLTGIRKIEPLITHSYFLDEIDKAMETANSDPDAVKVMIRP